MAAITATAANIRASDAFAIVDRKQAAGAINNGEAVTLQSANTIVKTADASAKFYGIAVSNDTLDTAAASGESVGVVTFGVVEGFTGLTPGKIVYLGSTAGTLDDAAGTVVVGYCRTSTSIMVMPTATAVGSS